MLAHSSGQAEALEAEKAAALNSIEQLKVEIEKATSKAVQLEADLVEERRTNTDLCSRLEKV